MCGIGGIISGGEADTKKVLHNFQKVLVHRGPDSKGYFIDSKNSLEIGFAHTRLSIIDLSPSANQPISNEDESIYLICNGEIYNYKELRKNLIKNHRFKSESDSEVIVHLYEEKGESLLEDLRGMFAFAIWDKKKNKLFLARDRFGIKPLYYSYENGNFVFASEIKALSKSGLIKEEINPMGINLFLLQGSISPPYTIYKKIFSLEPGHFLTFNLDSITKKCYYSLTNAFLDNSLENENITEEEAIKKVHSCLVETIKYHLVSDVPVGVFLSGGIDSSSIVALVDEAIHKSKSIKTVSVIFPGTDYDESGYARQVAQKFNTEHNEVEISDKDLKRHLTKIFYYMDQPTIDGVNSYFVSWATAKTGLKVALSGLGGDEVFFGYSTFTQIPKIYYFSKIFSFVPLSNKIAGLAFRDSVDLKAKACSMLSSNSLSEIYYCYRGLFTKDQIKWLLTPDFSISDIEFNLPAELKDYHSQISFLELTNYMPNQLLRDTDVFSMANSIEVRVPFLDHKLVELLARIPVKYKINGDIPKRLLVKSIGNKLPHEIVYRKKRGFNFPFDSWMRNELRNFIEDKIKESGCFNETFTNKLLEGFYNKKVRWSRIWGCTVLSQWLDNHGEKFLEHSS